MKKLDVNFKYRLTDEDSPSTIVRGEKLGNTVSDMVTVDFPDSLDEAIEEYGESEVFATWKKARIVEIQAEHRLKLQRENQHAPSYEMDDETKAKLKAKRAVERQVLSDPEIAKKIAELLKQKGI